MAGTCTCMSWHHNLHSISHVKKKQCLQHTKCSQMCMCDKWLFRIVNTFNSNKEPPQLYVLLSPCCFYSAYDGCFITKIWATNQTDTYSLYIYFIIFIICRYFIYRLMNWYLLKWTKYQFNKWDTNYGFDESEIKRNWTISHSIIFAFLECVCSLRMNFHWVEMNTKAIFSIFAASLHEFSANLSEIRKNNKKISWYHN